MSDVPDHALEALARVVADTVHDEISCEQLLDRLGAYVEHRGDPKALPPLLKAVEEHLRICPECMQEYQALLAAIGRK